MARLKQIYQEDIIPALIKEFGYTNKMAVPKMTKIVVNIGIGEGTQNVKLLDVAAEELSAISGQKAVITRAKRAIAAFKLREGMPIGVMCTLRRNRMYEFFDRLVNVAMPRIRDFRGVSPRGFDGRGNYTLGLRDQLLFPEVNLVKTEHTHGMNVTLVTTAGSDAEGRFLLDKLGVPFAKSQEPKVVAV